MSDPNAHANYMRRTASALYGILEQRQDSFHVGIACGSFGQPVGQDDKLISAEAPRDVTWTESPGESAPDYPENLVPPVMAMKVVDGLESVQIQEDQRGIPLQGERIVELFEEGCSIEQAGQAVMRRLISDLAVDGPAVADFAHDAHGAEDAAVVVSE